MSADKRGIVERILPNSVRSAPTAGKKLFELFIAPNDDPLLQFFRYIFVGGVSFVVDTAVLMLCSALTSNSLIYVSAGFIVGVITNFVLSKIMVFQGKKVRPTAEFTVVLIISVIGLWLTNLLFSAFMLLFAASGEFFCKLLSKILSAAIVLIWNFLARKVFYKIIDRRVD